MKLFLTLALAVITVLLCDKFEDRLPPPISWLYASWKKFSHVLGTIMSFIILSVLWFVGFGVYAIVTKVIAIPKRFTAEPSTYWIDANTTTTDSMKQQF